jgi:hypothetical protein
MRSILSGLLFLHGLVHVVGFVAPMNLVPNAHFQTMAFGRPLPNASPAARSLGVLWLLNALAFSVASVGVFADASWWFPAAVLVLLGSMMLCITSWPTAKVGLVLDVTLLAACLFVERAQLWSDLLALLRVLPL